jgi:hypothetical protein
MLNLSGRFLRSNPGMNPTLKFPLVLFILSLVALVIPPLTQADPKQVNLGLVGRAADEGTAQTAEIATFVPGEDLAFVTDAANNELDAFDWTDPASPQFLYSIDLSPWGLGPSSVVYTPAFGGSVAVAVYNDPARGSIQLFDLEGKRLAGYRAGWLPDMVTTTEDGRTLLVANEGEPLADGDTDELLIDPPGSVSIIELPPEGESPRDATVTEVSFTGVPLRGPVRVFVPGSSVEQDLEPEYITVKGNRAWVSIQDNNAIGILNIAERRFEVVRSLGFKDHGVEGNGIDASDRDGVGNTPLANIRTHENVFGMYQPDAISAFTVPIERLLTPEELTEERDAAELAVRALSATKAAVKAAGSKAYRTTYKARLKALSKGSKSPKQLKRAKAQATRSAKKASSRASAQALQKIVDEARDGVSSMVTEEKTFVATTNEGDARDYSFYSEESRVGSLSLDPTAFSPTAQTNAELARLTVTTTLGDENGDGLYEELYAFGARSMSLLDTDGRVVYDTGDEMEQLALSLDPTRFNIDHAFGGGTLDNRSDNKGPEPEAIDTGVVDGTTYAFVAAERSGMVYAYDLSTTPGEAMFAGWINTREDDRGPEGMEFLTAAESPNGQPSIMVTYEVSGTTSLYAVTPAD